MKKRILSTIFLWLFVIFSILWQGVKGGFLLILFASAFTQFELYQLMEKIGWKPFKLSATIFGMLMLYGCFFLNEGISDLGYLSIFLGLSIVLFSIFVILSGKPESIKMALLPTLFGITYVPTMFSFPLLFINKLALISEPTLPLLLVLWIVVVAKFSDVGGLLIGRKFGKHKLAHNFSPQKTYEGLIGSIIFSILAGYIFAFCCGHYWPTKFSNYIIGLLSALIAIIALISDLIESGFKRLAGEKDSGNTIPGIGGIFDLTDSLILSLPVGVIAIKEFILT